MLVATVSHVLGTTKDDGKHKLGLYKVYDFTKGGTDIIDQRMGFYTCKPKSRRWTITSFSYVLDMARVNSSTTFALKHVKDPCKQNSFEYGYELLMKLVVPQIESRNLNGIG